MCSNIFLFLVRYTTDPSTPTPLNSSSFACAPARQVLDRYFGNVCELDLIYNFHKAYYILDELLIAGQALCVFLALGCPVTLVLVLFTKTAGFRVSSLLLFFNVRVRKRKKKREKQNKTVNRWEGSTWC